MSVLNSVSESQKSNKKDYMKLLHSIKNYFRHQLLVGNEHEDSDSLLDEEEDVEIPEDNEEMQAYVREFRIKVTAGLPDREEVREIRDEQEIQIPRPQRNPLTRF
jgi:hypothetical protein